MESYPESLAWNDFIMEIVNFKALINPGRDSDFNAFLSQLFQGFKNSGFSLIEISLFLP